MNEELKPCPFCGSEAKLIDARKLCVVTPSTNALPWSVCCANRNNCSVLMPSTLAYATKEEAINAWNNRAQGSIYDMFPHIYWTKRNPMQTLEDKINKLVEEAAEVTSAKDYMDIIDETLDVMHCCVEILRDCPEELVDESLLLHNAKNRKRGYYEPKQE